MGWVRKRTTCSSWQGCVASTYGDHKTLKNLGGEMSKGYSHRGGLKGAFIWGEIASATVLCFGPSFSARLLLEGIFRKRKADAKKGWHMLRIQGFWLKLNSIRRE